MESDGLPCCYLQGEMPQDKRIMALSRFKSGEVKLLVATDVAARGIDVPDVSHVINFDLPRTSEIYVHRIGRTARAGKKGTAISIVEAHDMAQLSKLERYTKQKLPMRFIDGLRPENKIARVPVKKKKVKLTARAAKRKDKKAKKKK